MSNQINPLSPAHQPSPATLRTDRTAQPRATIPLTRKTDDKRADTSRGHFTAILEEGLGQAHLPDAIELIAALEAARNHAGMADRAVPGLGRLVTAVIDDETHKLSRYLDLRSQ